MGLPPVVRLAGAFSLGAGLALTGAHPLLAPPLLLLLWLPIRASSRPISRLAWTGAAVAGAVAGWGAGAGSQRCEELDGEVVTGRFLAAPAGASAPFSVDGRACRRPVRVVADSGAVAPGWRVRVEGRWREGRFGRWFVARRIESEAPAGWSLRWAAVRWRGRLVERVHALYGPRGPLVSALLLARREGLDRQVRDAFARTGTAHLLAISGFHVGVIAALLLVLARTVARSRRQAVLLASAGTWAYVALIGFPDAATRAALILSLVALSRSRGRPPARWGALATAFLLLLLLGPVRLQGVGFQLSFAGAAGLVAWAPGIRRRLVAGGKGKLPGGVARGVAAGVAATAATLPVVAWHFERVSVVGIPATLVASPLVALALPGALASLLLDMVHPGSARFVAGGVDVILVALTAGTRWAGALPWASVWTPRSWVAVAVAGAWVGHAVSARRRIGARVRRRVGGLVALSALVAWPVLVSLGGRGTVEVLVLDVGQGDALALRSPLGRWILVDAGPAGGDDPGGHPVVRALRRRGVTRLEMLALTHPDLDHIGGASAVLSTLPVGMVLDPGRAAGKEAYLTALETARRMDVPWRAARAGARIDVDGMVLEVLHPPARATGGRLPTGGTESNATSVVIRLRYGAFDALLTGDAPAEVEREVSASLEGDVEVLKVAHHGSDTSTDSLLLLRARPEAALLSVGRGNRYGHPSPRVLARLRRAGVVVRRTDLEGTLRLVARRDGRFQLSSAGVGGR